MPSLAAPTHTKSDESAPLVNKAVKQMAKHEQQHMLANDGVPPHLWRIHGKLYDLSTFVKIHPGGEDYMLLGRGRDCTELFESVHVLANRDVHAILAKYEVKDAPVVEDMFEWKQGGFYDTLRTRVRAHFATKDGRVGNYKANWKYCFKVVLQLLSLITVVCTAFYTNNLLFAFLAGIITESLALNLTHDGSHGGISKRPWLNRAGLYFGCFFLWDSWMWLVHHVYGHHSYTGVNRKDPDLNNSKAFLRKHPEGRHKSWFKWQHLYVWPLMLFFPNQHIGQVLQYTLALGRNRIFGVPLPETRPAMHVKPTIFIFIASLLINLVLPVYAYGSLVRGFLHFFLLFLGTGIAYFFVVAPNHDSVENAIDFQVHDRKVDWGEQQVRSSGNHSTDMSKPLNRFITQCFGAMNFQIEHHLFPSINNTHLQDLAPIVEQTCKEFNIPYLKRPSWLHTVYDYFRLLKTMSTKPHAH